jgi:diguanylate cyclase (GGDEF)-like protein
MDSPHPTLLVVSPAAGDARLLRELVGGAAVTHAEDAESAVAALVEDAYDAIVLDAALAAPASVRVLLDEDPQAQVIVLGDPAGPEAVTAARAVGAVDHLPRTGLDAATLERAVRYASDHRQAIERLQHDALHDALTGLPNRTLFADRVEQSLRRSRRAGPGAAGSAVLFVDLDRFKSVNDSLGHQAGDRLLRVVAERLHAALRPGDTVARIGGDEFTVLLEEVTDPREAAVVAERVLATLAEPFELAGREVFISGSIGIALGGADSDPEQLIRDADVAMYRAKAQGKARHAVFDDDMQREVVARLDLETELRRAIEGGALRILFQPVVRTATGQVAGFEALCRWDVDPHEFVAMAEETGLIVPLGAYVLEEAARRAAEWDVPVSVNVSARQLADPGFTAVVEAALRRSGARPAHVRVEVTEAAMTQDRSEGEQKLRDLRDRVGVTAVLDDFGTGASSLRFLQRFPGPALKIDQGLVLDMPADPGAQEIVRAIVSLAHNLGMEVVGEGVETAAHLEALQALGCEYAQGFHLSPSLTAEEAARLLAPAPRAAEPELGGAAEAGVGA